MNMNIKYAIGDSRRERDNVGEPTLIENTMIPTRTSGYLADGYTHAINILKGYTFADSVCGIDCCVQFNNHSLRTSRVP
jgi:hypothetical protein